MSTTDLFLQIDLQMLSEFGLPPRLLMLYGRLRLHARKSGKCFVRHDKLAEEIGLHGKYRDRQVRNLLNQLRYLRLISWQRRRYCNSFDVHDPDRKWISDLTGKTFPLSDRKNISDRKDVSSSKEVLKEAPSPTPPPSGAGALRTTPPRKPEGPTGKAQETEKSDDDEPKSRPQALSPEQEFRCRLIERHGSSFDADRCIQNVRRQLEKAAGLSMADFLACDLKRTTAPAALKNPNGYYTTMAKELRSAAVAATLDTAYEPLRHAAKAAPPEPLRNAHGRCVECNGVGRCGATFCGCSLGRDLEKLERREVQAEKKGPLKEGPAKIPKFPKKGA